MEKPDSCKWTAACPQQDFIEADTLKSLKVDRRPPLVLNIALALQVGCVIFLFASERKGLPVNPFV